MINLLVVGELALDEFDGDIRPGGASYSAMAARKMGLHTCMAGPIGMTPVADSTMVLDALAAAEIDTRLVRRLPTEKLTRFVLRNFDEVEPQFLISGSPLSRMAFDLPDEALDIQAVLLYPVHMAVWEQVMKRWPQAVFAVDLQYDMVELAGFESCLERAHIVFTSYKECLNWTGAATVAEAAQQILHLGPKIVVFKFGQGGSAIYTSSGEVLRIPAFTARYQYTVGAGDVYNAVFLALYLRGQDLEQCGRASALAASRFTETLDPFESWRDPLDEEDDRTEIHLHPDTAASINIYLAAPFFNQAELGLLERVKTCLESYRFGVFSPYHKVGRVSGDTAARRRAAFHQDIDGLDQADIVVALIDGDDTGTAWECGYAYHAKKPVITLGTERRHRPNLMLEQGAQGEFNTLKPLVNYLFQKFNELK